MSLPSQMNLALCVGFTTLLLTACTSTTTTPVVDRHQYLKQFVGQSSHYIQTQLDLKKIGYEQVNAAKETPTQMIYTVQRPMTIPIPSGGGIGAVPIPFDSSQSYNIQVQCKIIYDLKDKIAQAVSYSGRTC